MIADPNANRVIVPPQRITDIPGYSAPGTAVDGDKKPKAKTFKLQFQAPPAPGQLKVHAYFVSDSYLACSVDLPIVVSRELFCSFGDDFTECYACYSSKSKLQQKSMEQMTKTMIFPTQRKILLLDRWQLSRVKRSSGPTLAMTIVHLTRRMTTKLVATMIQATRTERHPSEGKEQNPQTTRVIRTVIKCTVKRYSRLPLHVYLNQHI